MVICPVVSPSSNVDGGRAAPVSDEARRMMTMRSEMVCFFIGIPLGLTWGVLIHKDISIIILRKIKK
jgi:hypothetical protein